jgi:hypothetical protein
MDSDTIRSANRFYDGRGAELATRYVLTPERAREFERLGLIQFPDTRTPRDLDTLPAVDGAPAGSHKVRT